MDRIDNLVADMKAGSALVRFGDVKEHAFAPRARYSVECFDSFGELKWQDFIDNLVTNEGRFEILDKYFKLATLPTAWFVGIIEDTSYTAVANADTLASHGGWTECSAYAGTRKTWTPGTITGTTTTSVDNTASPAAFAINATKTVKGCFMATVTSGTSGKLYSAGLFTGGDRAVVNGDTLNVSVTLTMS